ncbi:N-acetyltransferase [Acinetobacter rathckeae]|uniref:hypothetical protein n=1 Tax=Acinetobacter rathckeae TaxID=2605272 RepID=UPI002B1BD65F|nr:hypothetical protein [Acinetobacter rathckeae]
MKKLAISKGYNRIVLNVSKGNVKAFSFYSRHCFNVQTKQANLSVTTDDGAEKMVRII